MESEEIDWKRPRGYQDLIEAVSLFNSRLSAERAAGLPYVDGQTGIAMVSVLGFVCNIDVILENGYSFQPTTYRDLSTRGCPALTRVRCTATSRGSG